jgi:hypothetical protein
MYDYMLGGKDNFAIDREVGELALRTSPEARDSSLVNRGFLRRAIRNMISEAGITQFLDIGSGLPTQRNVHEIAHEICPEARVVYVDNDPMALAHGRVLLADSDSTIVVGADLRDPEGILGHPEVTEHLDFTKPVGLLLLAILHHIHDRENPGDIAATLRAGLCSGSHLAISHFRNPGPEMPDLEAKANEAERVFNAELGTGRWRTQDEILAYFGDFDLLGPGLVPLNDWRPDYEHTIALEPYPHQSFVGGVARKP